MGKTKGANQVSGFSGRTAGKMLSAKHGTAQKPTAPAKTGKGKKK